VLNNIYSKIRPFNLATKTNKKAPLQNSTTVLVFLLFSLFKFHATKRINITYLKWLQLVLTIYYSQLKKLKSTRTIVFFLFQKLFSFYIYALDSQNGMVLAIKKITLNIHYLALQHFSECSLLPRFIINSSKYEKRLKQLTP
jgi:hypothetical protein